MPAFRIVAAASALAACLCGRTLAQGETTCARDLLVAQSMQRQAIDQLEQADGENAKNCRIWRRHIETMRRVASVYGRCLSGSERSERLAQVQGSDREFSAAIKANCKGP
jgi:hypothetical protein